MPPEFMFIRILPPFPPQTASFIDPGW